MKPFTKPAGASCLRHRSIASTVAALLSAALAASAHAQTTNSTAAPAAQAQPMPDVLEEVVVTGTQVHGVAAPIGSALLVVGQDEMQASGQQTTADLIRQLPFVSQIGAGEATSNSAANLGSLNITRAQGIDLRGLGTQATLTLLDGRRVVPGGEGAQLFDPSSLPAIALQRIEIVPDGASATYGTDAVAGVVNLLLRKNFNGAEVTASQGWADDFAGQQRIGAILGRTWDGGSFTIAGEFFHHPALAASSRPTLYDDNQAPFGGSDLRNLVGAPGNINVGGTLYGLPPGSGVGVTPAQFSTTLNKTSQWAEYSALPDDNRASVVVSAEQHLTERIKLWLEGYFTDRRTISEDEPQQLTGIQVPSTNPFFIPAAAGPCTGGRGLCDSVNYSFINDLGAVMTHTGEQAYQVALGTDIDLGHDFKFELYGTTNQDAETDKFTGLNSDAVAAALDQTSPTTALNVFGSGGNNNPATLATLVGYNNYTTHYFLNLLNAKVDGPVYDLPAGSVRVAVGTEYHHDELHGLNYGDTGTANLGVFAVTANNTTARSVSSAYIEAVVPIFGPQNAVPGAARLELDVAGRYDHYSDFGSTENPKFGLRWDPVVDLTTHASMGRSFRAPTLCDVNPLCTGGTVTLPFPDLGWQKNNPPSIFGPGVSLTAIEVGGNAALKPETAKTYSFGVDWHPQAVSGLTTTVDYYYIDYKNIIDTPAAFNPAAGLLPEFAPFVTRNPTLAEVLAAFSRPGTAPQTFPPQLVNLIVNGTRQNVGEALTDGLDFSVKKLWDSPFGQWLTAINGTYVLKYDYSLVPGAPLLNVLNTVQGSGNAYPLRFTARAQFGWHNSGFSANGFLNYHNSYTNTAAPAGLPNESIASYTTLDVTVGYDTGKSPSLRALQDFSVSLSAINVTNRLPPFALIGTQDFDSTTGGPLGRLLTLELRKKF